MPEAPTIDEPVDLIENVLAVLAGLGIAEVHYDLSGGGDSGECTLESVVMTDGSIGDGLPDMTISFTAAGHRIALDDFLSDHAAEVPEDNWCDNDGGSGTVVYRPGAEDEDERIECCMSYGDEDDFDYDDQDQDDDDIDLDDVDLIDDGDDDEGEGDDDAPPGQDVEPEPRITVNSDLEERKAA